METFFRNLTAVFKFSILSDRKNSLTQGDSIRSSEVKKLIALSRGPFRDVATYPYSQPRGQPSAQSRGQPSAQPRGQPSAHPIYPGTLRNLTVQSVPKF